MVKCFQKIYERGHSLIKQNFKSIRSFKSLSLGKEDIAQTIDFIKNYCKEENWVLTITVLSENKDITFNTVGEFAGYEMPRTNENVELLFIQCEDGSELKRINITFNKKAVKMSLYSSDEVWITAHSAIFSKHLQKYKTLFLMGKSFLKWTFHTITAITAIGTVSMYFIDYTSDTFKEYLGVSILYLLNSYILEKGLIFSPNNISLRNKTERKITVSHISLAIALVALVFQILAFYNN
ncbi:MAG: hypothetical protein K0R71_598 [Bacillales bacterium]|jgi:hypothetical protein|nr:hypothetical protein [Bacillales bacterium]